MKLDNRYWRVEFWRFVLVMFVAFVGGMLSDHWLLCLALSLVGYIIWFILKLYKFNTWLAEGASEKKFSDSDGIWLCVGSRIVDMQRKSKKRKKRTTKFLKRIQAIVKGLPDATLVLNEANEIDWANEKALDYLNIDIKKDRGQRVDNIIRSPAAVELFNKKIDGEIEISLPHKSTRQLTIQYVNVKKDLKLVLARDISDQIYVQQMRKNFISNASHELRTPLTVISGYLEMLNDDDTLPEHVRTALHQSSLQSERMKNIIEDMLTLSRLEKSVPDEDTCVTINVPSILESICANEVEVISNNSHKINTQIDDSVHLHGIESEIISVLNNLIGNALRHTPAGTEISIEWFMNTDHEACCSVADNGPGIPEEHIAHLTERFYRVDRGRSREDGGTGLGLSIVQHIIQRHGGNLAISSTYGKGSSFIATFPTDKTIDLQTAAA